MLKTFNLILLVSLSFLYSPVHTKEISKDEKYLSDSVEEIAEEMINLNSSLGLLSITISNLATRNRI